MPGPAVRRVITGHDSKGNAIVWKDETAQGERFTLIWTSQGFPVDNTSTEDGGRREVGITLAGGSVFRIGEIAPGGRSPVHRTNSIDYGIVLDGDLDMELDGGEVVHLKSGDVVVQRGTNHAWINNSERPCRMAWILIDAHPVRVDGTELQATM
jgi:quercetin dioxygenase-like cupin family protein